MSTLLIWHLGFQYGGIWCYHFGIWILDLNFWIQLSQNSRGFSFFFFFLFFPLLFFVVGYLLAPWDLWSVMYFLFFRDCGGGFGSCEVNMAWTMWIFVSGLWFFSVAVFFAFIVIRLLLIVLLSRDFELLETFLHMRVLDWWAAFQIHGLKVNFLQFSAFYHFQFVYG